MKKAGEGLFVLTLMFLVISFLSGSVVSAENVIKLGVTTPLSGAAAVWGMTQTWCANEVANRVNEAGGVTVKGEKYIFKVIVYDNQYTSAEGAKVANKLIFDDKVNFIIGTLGSSPTLAMQEISEPNKILTFSTAWTRESKGPKKAYTFATINSAAEIYPALVPWIKNKYPKALRVASLAPNDATGWDAIKVSVETWEKAGLKVVKKEFYERGTTEFHPIVTKLRASKPDIMDICAAPPGDASLLLKGLKEQGWEGIKILPATFGLKKFVEIAGKELAEGTYLTLNPDYTSRFSTPIQKELYAQCLKEKNLSLDAVAIGCYDAMQALLVAIKKTDSLDSTVLAKILPTIAFEGSSGWSVFGREDYYGSQCQILQAVRITQVQNGEGVDVDVSRSAELVEKLKKLGIQ